MTTALYIGRFQPFHNGHLDAIRQIFENSNVKRVCIGIGSAEDSYLPKNPFTAGERFEIIESALLEAGFSHDKFIIVPLRDIHNYALWPHHVMQLCPKFDFVYSGSALVRKIWEDADLPNIEVRSLEKRIDVSATAVRKKILNEENVSQVLPPTTQKWMEKLGAKERLEKI
jgi:nicotinamide-nucleotide adenylyltransferase